MLAPAQSRLQVGGTGLAYLVVAALILGAALMTQNNLMFWAFGLMIGGFLISLALAWLSLRKVRIERLLPDHAVVGEALVIRYHLVNNKLWLPAFNLIIQESWGRGPRGWRKAGPLVDTPPRLGGLPVGWVLHLGPKQTTQAEAVCWPRRRGILTFERLTVSSSFPFGVIRRVLEFPQEGKVLVYPRLYRISQALWFRLTMADPIGHLQMDRGGGTEEFFGLRPYRVGDNLRSIDWKHSAKSAELIARDLTQPSPPRLMVLLDLSAGSAGASPSSAGHRGRRRPGGAPPPETEDGPAEKAISLAASILCAGHLQGYQTGLAVIGASAPLFRVHHSVPHRARMLEALSRLEVLRHNQPPQHLTIDPTLLITAGDPCVAVSRRCISLDVRDMAQYVRALEGGSARLLARGAAPRSKRQRLMMSQRWT